MPPQVSREAFASALLELGHNPDTYRGQRLSLSSMCELYDIDDDIKQIAAHYDYLNDTIWVDALDAAHFFFCIKNEAHLYAK